VPEVPQNSAPAAAPAAPPATPEKSPVPQSSIAAELSRVYDQKVAEKAGSPAAISPGQGVPAPETKARGEDGRFASNKPPEKSDAKPEAKPAADTKAAPAKAAPEDPKAAEAKAVADKEAADKAEKAAKLKPHPRWKPEQEKLQKLAAADPDSAKFVIEREKEAEKFIKATPGRPARGRKFKALDDILTPGRQARSMQGVDDPTFMRSLVAASDFLAKEPAKGLKMLAEQYGVNLKQIAEAPQESPHVRAARDAGRRTRELHSISLARATRSNSFAAPSSRSRAFQAAEDEQGQPLYPHFDEVVDDITWPSSNSSCERGSSPTSKPHTRRPSGSTMVHLDEDPGRQVRRGAKATRGGGGPSGPGGEASGIQRQRLRCRRRFGRFKHSRRAPPAIDKAYR
jgi:hypothetical protein